MIRWSKSIANGIGHLQSIIDIELDCGQHDVFECQTGPEEQRPCGKCEKCRNYADARKAEEWIAYMAEKHSH